MIPLINNNFNPLYSGAAAGVFAVTGFRRGCGKSTLAHALALSFVEAGKTTCLVQVPTNGPNSNAFTQHMRTVLGKTGPGDYPILTEADDLTAYECVIYDGLPVGTPTLDRCFYITPEFAEDFDLGVTCEMATKFRCGVQDKIFTRFASTSMEFISIGRAVVSPESELLARTDWMALRALEALYLQDTDIATLRTYIRNTDLNGWEPSA